MVFPFLFLPVLVVTLFLPSVVSQLSPFPGYVPLAIRSPYFNCWVNASTPMTNWPVFSNNQAHGWVGIIKVDGVAYEYLGNGNPTLNVTNLRALSLTPTRTIYTMQAGSMEVNITFLSPIESTDLVKQSMPFSYFYIDAVSLDGQPHAFQVYADLSGGWAVASSGNLFAWETVRTSSSIFHTIRPLPSPGQNDDPVNDATEIIGMLTGPNVTATIAVDLDSRNGFVHGQLPASITEPQGTVDNPFKVFAIAVDLGTITATTQSVTWTMGIIRDPVVVYTTATGALQNRSSYFMSKYPDIQSAVDAFLLDFDNARSQALEVDNTLLRNASDVSSILPNIVSLTARQTIGATEVTITKDTDGNWNMSDVKMFMKNVGVDSRVNPVEIIYQSLPFFLSMNPQYAGYLLSPLLEYQGSSQYTQAYAATDIGQSYPHATGSNRAHIQGIEQSGNMLIMLWAHARCSGDGQYISQHYDLLRGWAEYLANNTLTPSQQVTADLESHANMTNLAIKGILGIEAMHQISQALGKPDDAGYFAALASSLTNNWLSLAMSSDGSHLLATYDDQQSWTLPYNLYADKLMQTQLINSSLYNTETSFVKGLFSSTSAVATPFGIPLDTLTVSQTDAGWLMFMAATVTDPLTASLASKIYNLNSSGTFSGLSSPGFGSAFAPMAMNLLAQPVTVPQSSPLPSSAPPSQKTPVVAPVIAGVIGGLALVTFLLVAIFLWRRRQRRQLTRKVEPEFHATPNPIIQASILRHNLSEPSLQDERMRSLPTKGNRLGNQTLFRSSTAPTALISGSTANRSAGDGTSLQTESQSDVRDLRAEVENLRRAMEQIQNSPPPSYHA